MVKITLWPSQETIEVEKGSSLLQSLKSQGIKIKSSCGGKACCGECVVIIRSGAENLSSPEYDEIKLLGNVFHITKERLSCQTKINGDVMIDISAHCKEVRSIKDEKPSFYSKNKSTVKRRKKENLPEKETENKKSFEPKEELQKEKKLGGNRRPRPFQYSEED